MTASQVPFHELRGVVFDLDGVIIDSHAAHRVAWRKFLQGLGLEVSESELNFILDGRKRRDILRHFLGNISEEELLHHGRCKDRIFHEMQADVPPVPGVFALIHELRRQGIAIALASSASKSRALSTLARLNIADCFGVTITADDVATGKPDPASYALAAQRMDEQPGSLLAVEDAVSGVQAATTAGLTCVAITSHERRENLLAAGALETVADFSQISVEDLTRIHQGCSLTFKTG